MQSQRLGLSGLGRWDWITTEVMMRKCLYCGEEIPEGTIGQYCDPAHKWLAARKREEARRQEKQYELPLNTRQTRMWGKSPRSA